MIVSARRPRSTRVIASLDSDADADTAWAVEAEARARRALAHPEGGTDWEVVSARVVGKLRQG